VGLRRHGDVRWGGINDRAKGVEAGNDLEMPGSGDYNRNKVVAAVREGRLATEALARCATAVVALRLRAAQARKPEAHFDAVAHHALARRIGGEAVVLLMNEGDVLPLPAGKKVALIGRFARTPRFQGAGSSMVNPIRITNAYDELAALLGEGRPVLRCRLRQRRRHHRRARSKKPCAPLRRPMWPWCSPACPTATKAKAGTATTSPCPPGMRA
jgi:beta-glucosidase-like glycosyl hydrolase